MRSDVRLGIGWALGMVDIPQPGNPTRAEQIVEFSDFFGQFHLRGSSRSKFRNSNSATDTEILKAKFDIEFRNVFEFVSSFESA
jgi:hypothetical protein